MSRHIVKHKLTHANPCYKTREGKFIDGGFNFRHSKMFFNESHPLMPVYESLLELVPFQGECENDALNAFRVLNNAYYDLYNNGTGNSCRWSFARPFKKSIRKLYLTKEEVGSLEYRLTEVYSYMGRGRNFGCVAPGCEGYLRKEMEELMTDVIYYTGLIFASEKTLEIQAMEDPYDVMCLIREEELKQA